MVVSGLCAQRERGTAEDAGDAERVWNVSREDYWREDRTFVEHESPFEQGRAALDDGCRLEYLSGGAMREDKFGDLRERGRAGWPLDAWRL
jgi:hypothetical protein